MCVGIGAGVVKKAPVKEAKQTCAVHEHVSDYINPNALRS